MQAFLLFISFFLDFHVIIELMSPAGLIALRDVGVEVVSVDPCGDAECAAESASLTRWQFQDLKSADKRKPDVELVLHGSDEFGLDSVSFFR